MAPALTLYSPPPELSDSPNEPDLPPLYTKPPATQLLHALSGLTLPPPSWDTPSAAPVAHLALTKWLTGVIASPLRWVTDSATQEAIWESASARLAERCGRTAMPSTTRFFRISPTLELQIHEPTLTADNLGLKTWASSYLLSKRLPQLPLPRLGPGARVLELGAGTGLVGLAAAGTWDVAVVLTDLPDIVPNLRRNVEANEGVVGGRVEVAVLDWREGEGGGVEGKFGLVVAADPIYEPEHPGLVARMVGTWLERGGGARAVVEMPLRAGFEGERAAFRGCMGAEGLAVVGEGEETGFDDWGEGGEVRCWWAVWAWAGAGAGI